MKLPVKTPAVTGLSNRRHSKTRKWAIVQTVLGGSSSTAATVPQSYAPKPFATAGVTAER